jgi:hypothetical protein
MIKDLDMLRPLFTFVAALFGQANRADEPVGRGLHFDTSAKPLVTRAKFFRAVSFYFGLTVLHIQRGVNSLLCLPEPHWLNPVRKCWHAAVAIGGISDFHGPKISLSVCFSMIISGFTPRSDEKFMLEAAPGIGQEISKACRQSRKERSRSMT